MAHTRDPFTELRAVLHDHGASEADMQKDGVAAGNNLWSLANKHPEKYPADTRARAKAAVVCLMDGDFQGAFAALPTRP